MTLNARIFTLVFTLICFAAVVEGSTRVALGG